MAKIDKTAFRELLKSPDMGFAIKNGETQEIWHKTYAQHDNYSIIINFDTEKIDYESGATSTQSIQMRGVNPDGTPVKATRKTTSNFAQNENMVVLECVNRLLEKGYKPNSIVLEKSWAAGHNTSEYLDVYVMQNNKSYAMIECKTWGNEYQKEKNKMNRLKSDGQPDGQLWAYLQYEKDTKLICLYSSHIVDGYKLEYTNDIIEIRDEWAALANSRDRFERWLETSYGTGCFMNAGIFEDDCGLYNTDCSQVRKPLKTLDKETASQLFQDFLEVLRHNAISDKANAFNKILNLFMCKIIDEEEPEERRQFWWDDNTEINEFMSILENLYKRGMDSFLNITITDYSDVDIDEILPQGMDISTVNAIKELFRKQKTERSSEFAFREIYNEETFHQNALIVREVVRLIQPYQFRYGHKHQFLGEFFEELLSTSIKQESGQFFTPIRIARFMCSSLPIPEETQKCLADNTKYHLPLVIDYACGSGHFLTEYMDIEQAVINDIDRHTLSAAQRRELGSSDNRDDDYKWASTYVYGIEKDYRLAKTTKLNTFLNGDGDANIINADGLAPFSTFDSTSVLFADGPNNGKFTFVLANPPYSVEDFAITMNRNSNNLFSLWQDKMSDNIECLFIERTAQLLKVGGYAAIIIPQSISFTDETLFSNTRRLLFEKFHIKAIVNLTGKCFAKTGVDTQILVLKRRKDKDAEDAKNAVAKFMKDGKDFSFDGRAAVVHEYLSLYGEELSFEDYVSFICHNNIDDSNRYLKRMSDTIKTISKKALEALEKTPAYKKAAEVDRNHMEQTTLSNTKEDVIWSNEYNKLYYYLLTMSDTMIIADTLKNEDCKRFTGLTFSERGGKQGTIIDPNNSLINDKNVWDDTHKLNYYIHKACLDQKEELDSTLTKHARWAYVSELFDYLGEFKNEYKATIKKNTLKPLKTGYIERQIGELFNSYGPNTAYDNNYIAAHKGEYPVFSAATLGDAVKGYIDTYDYDTEGIQISTNGINAGTVTYRKKQKFSIGSDNRVYYFNEAYRDTCNLKYMYHQIKSIIENAGYNWTMKCGDETICSYYIQIPILPNGALDISRQNKVANELDNIDKKINDKTIQIQECNKTIMNEFKDRFGNPVNNDKNWATINLNKDSCKNGLNYTYNPEGNTIKCLSVADFRDNYAIDNTDTLSEIVINETVSDDYLLKDNDIIFVRSNGNKTLVGRSILVHTGKESATFSGFCIRYRNEEPDLDSLFLLYMLKTQDVREELFGRGSNINNLNQEMLCNLNLILPPLQEQQKFIRNIVSPNKKKQDALYKDIATLEKRKTDLIDKYF